MAIPATAIEQPLEWVQGSTFEYGWIFKDINNTNWSYTGYTAKIDIRKKIGGALVTSLSSTTGEITFPGSGELHVKIPASVGVAYVFTGDSVEYYWDLELTNTTTTPNTILKPFLPSTFTVYKEVTL